MKRIVSIIPARGGSKGIPDKNIKEIAGEPLMFHSIRASIMSFVHDTWVSSDNHAYLKMCRDKFASCNTIIRPREYSTDEASTESVMKHFSDNVEFDIIVLIQPTSPMINEYYINQGLAMIECGAYDSVFSAVRSNDMLIWNYNQMVFPKSGYEISPINYDPNDRGRRQERERCVLIETGGFYITTKEAFFESACRISGHIGYVEVPFWESFQVDSPEDLTNIGKLMGEK